MSQSALSSSSYFERMAVGEHAYATLVKGSARKRRDEGKAYRRGLVSAAAVREKARKANAAENETLFGPQKTNRRDRDAASSSSLVVTRSGALRRAQFTGATGTAPSSSGVTNSSLSSCRQRAMRCACAVSSEATAVRQPRTYASISAARAAR